MSGRLVHTARRYAVAIGMIVVILTAVTGCDSTGKTDGGAVSQDGIVILIRATSDQAASLETDEDRSIPFGVTEVQARAIMDANLWTHVKKNVGAARPTTYIIVADDTPKEGAVGIPIDMRLLYVDARADH